MAGAVTGLLRFLLVAVVAAGAGAGIYFVARSNGGDSGAQVVAPTDTATLTETAVTRSESPVPPTLSPTQVPPTEAPTPYSALPPPPPRPDQPAVAETAVLAGGQWYQFQRCLFFYLPAGRSYRIHAALNDPGGYMSLAFEDEVSGSIVAFSQDDGSEVNRSVLDSELNPVFDQIAATISKEC